MRSALLRLLALVFPLAPSASAVVTAPRRSMKRNHGVRLALMLAGALLSGSPAESNLIENGMFDEPDIGVLFTTFNSAPTGFGWAIVSDGTPNPAATTGFDGVDLINSLWVGTGGTANPDGFDQSVDIDGVSSISQVFATSIGQTYRLELSYSHNFGGSSATGFLAVAGNTTRLSEMLVHNTPNSGQNMQWSVFSQTFTADSTSTTFTILGDASNGSIGFVVDDVRIVPEPSSALLLGLGLAALRARRRTISVGHQSWR